MAKQRNSSIELLRIVAMLVIVFFHFHARDYGMYVYGNERIGEVGIMGHTICHHIGMLGVPCFMFISGYYGIKFKWRRFADFAMQGLIYGGITIIYAVIALSEFTPGYLFFFNSWWFFMDYAIVYILSPGINCLIEQTSTRHLLLMLGVFYFIMLGGWFNNTYTTDGLMTLLCIYIAARVIRLRLTVRQRNWLIYVSLAMLLLHLLGILIAFKTVHLGLLPYLRTYDNPMNLLIVAGLVVAVEHIHFTSNVINYLASSCFAVYLLSEGNSMKLFWQPIFDSLEGTMHFVPTYIVSAMAVFLSCVAIDKVRNSITLLMSKR